MVPEISNGNMEEPSVEQNLRLSAGKTGKFLPNISNNHVFSDRCTTPRIMQGEENKKEMRKSAQMDRTTHNAEEKVPLEEQREPSTWELIDRYDAAYVTDDSNCSSKGQIGRGNYGNALRLCSPRLQPRSPALSVYNSVVSTNDLKYDSCLNSKHYLDSCVMKTVIPSRPHMSSSIFSGSKFQEGLLSSESLQSTPRMMEDLDDAQKPNDEPIKSIHIFCIFALGLIYRACF